MVKRKLLLFQERYSSPSKKNPRCVNPFSYVLSIKVVDFLSNSPLFSSFLPVFPRARTRQEFSCFLPSPLHLLGVNG